MTKKPVKKRAPESTVLVPEPDPRGEQPFSGLKKRVGELVEGIRKAKSDPVEPILTFVMQEIAREKEERLVGMVPLVLFFVTEKDRKEFVELWRETHPRAVSRHV